MTSDFWVLFTMGIIAFPSCADATPPQLSPLRLCLGEAGGVRGSFPMSLLSLFHRQENDTELPEHVVCFVSVCIFFFLFLE